MNNELGQRIKTRRKELNLTYNDIKNLCDIDSGGIARIENGSRIPSITTFHKLADALDCTMDWLMTGRNPEETQSRFPKLSENENKMLQRFRKLDNDDKVEILAIIDLKISLKRKKTTSSISMTSENRLGYAIRKVRQEQNIPMTDMQKYGISPSTLSMAEQGKSTPSCILFYQICQALHTSMEQLYAAQPPITPEEKFIDTVKQLDEEKKHEIDGIIALKLEHKKPQNNEREETNGIA